MAKTLTSELREELKTYGRIRCITPSDIASSTELPYARKDSARKPKGCKVPVEFCLDCLEPDCSYKGDIY